MHQVISADADPLRIPKQCESTAQIMKLQVTMLPCWNKCFSFFFFDLFLIQLTGLSLTLRSSPLLDHQAAAEKCRLFVTREEWRTYVSDGVVNLLWSSLAMFVNHFAKLLHSTLCQSPALKLGLIGGPAQSSDKSVFVLLISYNFSVVPQIWLLPEALALNRVGNLHYTLSVVIV